LTSIDSNLKTSIPDPYHLKQDSVTLNVYDYGAVIPPSAQASRCARNAYIAIKPQDLCLRVGTELIEYKTSYDGIPINLCLAPREQMTWRTWQTALRIMWEIQWTCLNQGFLFSVDDDGAGAEVGRGYLTSGLRDGGGGK